VFDRGSAELSRDGARIRLQALPCQLLAVLLERPGEIVTRDDLRERLWHADTFVDFEHGLNTAVKKLRQALGDSAEAPTFIETVARRGYRFIAPVELLPSPELALTSAAPPAAVPPGAPAVPAPAGAFPRPTVWFVAIAVVVLAAGVGWWNLGRANPSSAAAAAAVRTPTQLAVVPFRVLPGPDLESGYLGIGIADAITTRLAATRQIGVRSSSAVLPFAASQDDPVAIAASLGVEHLVVGAIQVTESAYRITVQLVRADGVAVWGRSYDEPRTALLDLQDDLAEQVVGALRLELGATERARLTFHYTDNAAAHEVYLRGRSLLLNYNEAKMLEAIKYFEQALALDGNYALARTGIATACAWFSVRYAHETDELGWAQRAQAEAMRALEQDGSLAEAHLALANAAGTTYGGFDWKTVLDRTATALSLNSSLELAHLARMRAYYHLGLFDAARREGREAERLNPSPSVERERLEVALLLFGGEFAAAVERAEALMQRSDAPEIYLGLARFYVGDTAGARKVLAPIMRGPRPDTRAQASLASIEAAAKLDRQARARLTRIEHASDIDHHVAYSVGAAYAQLGQADASLQWLEQAADTGFPCHVWFSRDPLLDPLRTHPRFVRLLARMEAAHTDSRPPSH
jgi:DNA-binding winged helix-turn-helix (wHTH) protein/TolB-like protein